MMFVIPHVNDYPKNKGGDLSMVAKMTGGELYGVGIVHDSDRHETVFLFWYVDLDHVPNIKHNLYLMI